MRDLVSASLEVARAKLGDFMPEITLVLGSGLSDVAGSVQEAIEIPYADLSGFPSVSVSGHGASLVCGYLGKTAVAVLTGRAHYYESGQADVMAVPLNVLKDLGCQTLLLTNSAGSLIPDVRPGQLMLITDHINMSGTSPLIGQPGGPHFIDLTQAYDAGLRTALHNAAQSIDIPLAEGVYVWMSGPQFETPAEIRMLQALGGSAVGMSTVPEVIIARSIGMRVAAVSTITNMGAGMEDGLLGHDQTLHGAKDGVKALRLLLDAYFAQSDKT